MKKTDLLQEPTKILTPRFVLLFVANFIVVSTYFLLITTMARYAETTYGADGAVAGLTASVFLVGAVLGRIICARYTDYIGIYRLTVFSLVVELIASLLYFAGGIGVELLIALRFVHGLGFGVANTVLPALAVDAMPPDRIGEGTGYFMLSNSLGVGVGPLMSILLVMGIDYTVLFIIVSATLAVALFISVAISRGQSTGLGEHPGKLSIDSIIDKSTAKFSIFIFLVAFSYSSINTFIINYAHELDMGFFAPFVFLMYSIALLLTRPVTGKLQDKYGENAVLYPSIISMAVGLLLAAFTVNPVMLVACGIFMATGFGTCMSIGQAAVAKLTTSNSSAKAISTFFLLCDGGCGIGPFFLGFAVTAMGYRWMYALCAGIALVGFAYYFFAHGRKARRLPNID